MIPRAALVVSLAALLIGATACGAAPEEERATADDALRAAHPTPKACDRPAPDDCSFYRACLEVSHPCGEDGYALAYGERLCQAFIDHRDAFSPRGQRWLRDVRTCLQRELVPLLHAPPMSCEKVVDDAYATHAGCYTAIDDSICALPARDVIELATILGADLFSARALSQIRDVAATCVDRLFGVAEASTSRRDFFRDLGTASGSESTLRSFLAQLADSGSAGSAD
ncbi:MAG TPA: hypothetical protein VLT33_34770 [Labilithrix sp.]|nr:hypothetical protein [Labilithrix sp.]